VQSGFRISYSSTGRKAYVFRGGWQERRESNGDVAMCGEASESREFETLW